MSSSNKNIGFLVAGILFAGATLLSSCKKFIELQPISGSSAGVVFGNVATTQQALMGVYGCLTGDQGYGIRLSMYYTVDNDELMGPTGDDQDRRGLAHYHLLPGNAQLEAPYDLLYAGIERANNCIHFIPVSDPYMNGSANVQAQEKRMLGEALTLRAVFYLELIRNWGDVPAPFDAASFLPSLNLPRMNRDSIYDRLLSDLALAETLVPWRGDPTITSIDERITKGAVKGMRARIALCRGGYALRSETNTIVRRDDYKTYDSIAMFECLDIINSGKHALNPSFKSVFHDYLDAHQIDNIYGELMFQVAMAGGTGQNDSKLGYYNGPKFAGLGNASLFILPTYFYRFDSTDSRRDVTCAPYDCNADFTKAGQKITNIRDGKFRRDWISPSLGTSAIQYFGVDWPILRYSDVLLMYAEADNEYNGAPSPLAIQYYEQVRTRAYGTNPIGTTPTDHDGFLAAIQKERSLEFGAEGIRKYDLNRWGILAQTLDSARSALTMLGSAPQPPFNTYPTSMYYRNGSMADNSSMWANSFYVKQPSSQPANTTKSTWIGTGIMTTFINPSYPAANTTTNLGFAGYFIPNQSELYPLPQHTVDASGGVLQQEYGY